MVLLIEFRKRKACQKMAKSLDLKTDILNAATSVIRMFPNQSVQANQFSQTDISKQSGRNSFRTVTPSPQGCGLTSKKMKN